MGRNCNLIEIQGLVGRLTVHSTKLEVRMRCDGAEVPCWNAAVVQYVGRHTKPLFGERNAQTAGWFHTSRYG